jgi:hypothetical protein
MAVLESGNIAVLAEKPSVAHDIAHVLGATSRGDGYLHGNGYVVTWALGHLAALAQPHEINPEWRHWRRDLLPILPKRWPLIVYEKTKDQFEIVRKIQFRATEASTGPRLAERGRAAVESECRARPGTSPGLACSLRRFLPARLPQRTQDSPGTCPQLAHHR